MRNLAGIRPKGRFHARLGQVFAASAFALGGTAAASEFDGPAAAAAEAAAPGLPVIPVAHDEAAAPVAAAPRSSASRVIEEIVVTAQKREENLKDVPISVAAFSGEKLDALGIKNPQDLQLATPGLSYTTPVGFSIIYIRGVGTDAFIPSADSSVGTYVDGIYFPASHGLLANFTDLQRIEILKGPQGTLFGRNTTGGAISIVTKDPSDHFTAALQGGLSNFNGREFKGTVSGPLLDGLDLSLAYVYSDTDLYARPVSGSPNQHTPHKRDTGFNPKLRWKISDELTMTLAGYFVKSDGDGLQDANPEDVKPIGTLLGVVEGPPNTFNSNQSGIVNTDLKTGYATVLWQPSPFDVKLLGSYQHVVALVDVDYDSGPNNAIREYTDNEYSRTTTGELQFISKPDGILTFSDTLSWTAGFYYYKNDGGYDPSSLRVLSPDTPAAAGLFAPATLLGKVLTRINELGIAVPDSVTVLFRGVVETEAYAGYAQGTWKPVDWMGLTLGGRYQVEDRGIVKSASQLYRPTAAPVTLFNFAQQDVTTRNFSPKVALDFKPFDDDTLLYVSWQKGYKSGTYNDVAIYTPPAYVKPEEAINYEVGVKGYLLDHSLSYNAAAFQSKVKNIQTLVVALTSGGGVQLVNAAQATIKGVDFDLTWQLLPDTLPGLVLNASGAYLHGVYDKFPDGAGFDPVTGLYFGPGQLVPTAPQDFSGNETVRTPKWSGIVGLTHTFEVPGGNIEIGVSDSYSDGFFYDTQNIVEQSAYNLVNARASYLYEPWNVRLSIFVNNLTDKTYSASKLITDFAASTTYAPPRIYGMTLRWEFSE